MKSKQEATEEAAVTAAPATVFVVDDDQAVRKALRLLIKSARLEVEAFDSAEAFIEAYKPDRPGCLILDIRMPGMSGLKLQDMLVSRGIDIPLIVITGHGDVSMAVRAMKHGAVDFLEKPFDDETLLARIAEAIELDKGRRRERLEREKVAAKIARLTPREREVMELLVSGLGNKEVALKLELSRKTVDIHRSHIMMKLAIDSVAELIRIGLAHRNGRS